VFDLVSWHGSEWRARRDEPGPLPGDGWALSGQAGSRGKTGEPGERGPAGLSGATIAEWAINDYRAAPIMSDGTTGAVLDLRNFFELFYAESARR
jgi:integrin beta 3